MFHIGRASSIAKAAPTSRLTAGAGTGQAMAMSQTTPPIPAVPPRLDHLNIVVSDLVESVRFYRTLFGMTVVLDRKLAGGWFETVTGCPGGRARCVILNSADSGLRIELLAYEEPPGRAEPATRALSTHGLRHFAVRVADIDAALALARSLGYAEAYLHDPDGVVVELAEYGRCPPPADGNGAEGADHER